MLPDRIELSTSPLPRECSTTELRQQGISSPSGADTATREPVTQPSSLIFFHFYQEIGQTIRIDATDCENDAAFSAWPRQQSARPEQSQHLSGSGDRLRDLIMTGRIESFIDRACASGPTKTS